MWISDFINGPFYCYLSIISIVKNVVTHSVIIFFGKNKLKILRVSQNFKWNENALLIQKIWNGLL